MAHFAKIEDGFVTQVIVVENEILLNDDGIEDETLGKEFCKTLFGDDTNWVQTSFNGSTRGKFAALGDFYDEGANVFKSVEKQI
jgi:hypothetical protein